MEGVSDETNHSISRLYLFTAFHAVVAAVNKIAKMIPTESISELKNYAYTNTTVNFRKKPNPGSDRIRQIKRYALLEVLDTLEQDNEKWAHVVYQETEGYVKCSYLTFMTMEEYKAFILSEEYEQGIKDNY